MTGSPTRSRASRSALDAREIDDALAPVVSALIADARRRAENVLSDAEHEARQVIDTASAMATAIMAEARREGERAARRSASALEVEARRQARRAVLDAHRHAYDLVRERAVDELVRRRDTPEAARLRLSLRRSAGARLGEGAVVREDEGCGIEAVLGARRVDLGTATLVDRALAAAGSKVSELWAP